MIFIEDSGVICPKYSNFSFGKENTIVIVPAARGESHRMPARANRARAAPAAPVQCRRVRRACFT